MNQILTEAGMSGQATYGVGPAERPDASLGRDSTIDRFPDLLHVRGLDLVNISPPGGFLSPPLSETTYQFLDICIHEALCHVAVGSLSR